MVLERDAIPCTDRKKKNEQILKEISKQRKLVKIIRKRGSTFLGHVMRKLKNILVNSRGKRPRDKYFSGKKSLLY